MASWVTHVIGGVVLGAVLFGVGWCFMYCGCKGNCNSGGGSQKCQTRGDCGKGQCTDCNGGQCKHCYKGTTVYNGSTLLTLVGFIFLIATAIYFLQHVDYAPTLTSAFTSPSST